MSRTLDREVIYNLINHTTTRSLGIQCGLFLIYSLAYCLEHLLSVGLKGACYWS